MGSGLVIVRPSRADLCLRIVQCEEPIRVKAFLTQSSVEALDPLTVDHREHAQLATIEQCVCDKIHAQNFIHRRHDLLRLTQLGRLIATWPLQPQQ